MSFEAETRGLFLNVASGLNGLVGANFSGKAYIFYFTARTSGASDAPFEDYILSLGFAEGQSSGNDIITQRYCSVHDFDGISVSDTYRAHGSSGIIYQINSGISLPSRKGVMTAISGDAGIQVRWTNINTSVATSGRLFWDSFGGVDLVNAQVGTFLAQSGHGNQTHSGVGFSGNILFLMSTQQASGQMDALSGIAIAKLIYGFAHSSSEQGCCAVMSEDTSPSADTKRWQRNDRIFLGISDAGQATVQAEFVGFTDDGFTINWISGSAAQSSIIGQPIAVHYLVMKVSGNVKVGDFSIPQGETAFTTSGIGFSGKYTQLLSWNQGLNNLATTSDDNRLTIGSTSTASGSISNIYAWVASQDAAGTMITSRLATNDNAMGFFQEAATSFSGVEMGSYDFSGYTADGMQFGLDVGNQSGDFSGTNVLYAMIGNTISGAAPEFVQDITRRAFGGESLVSFGGGQSFVNQETDIRPIFGPMLERPQAQYIQVSGQLI